MWCFIKNGDNCTHILHDESVWVVVKTCPGILQGLFAIFIRICNRKCQDIVLHGGQKETSFLAELQGNLCRFMGREFG